MATTDDVITKKVTFDELVNGKVKLETGKKYKLIIEDDEFIFSM